MNLRKANAVQAEIRKMLNSITLITNATINEYVDSIEVTIGSQFQELHKSMARKSALTHALFEIRKQVGIKNVSSNINSILADIEAITAEIQMHTTIANLKPRMELKEIQARLDKIKSMPNDSRTLIYNSDRFATVETSVLEQPFIDGAKENVKFLKRKLQSLQEDLLRINVNTLIELSEEVETTLKSEGIL
jgi:hypothetical protein